MSMGIAERNVMDGQGTQQEPENKKEVVYKFIRTRAAALNFKESTQRESLSTMALTQ